MVLHSTSRINRHTYEQSEVVVGGSLGALLHSYFCGIPCLYVSALDPFRFDSTLNSQIVDYFGLSGPFDRELWEKLVFILSISGQLPLENKAASISIQGGTLKATTSRSRLAKFKFDKLYLYDDSGIRGLPGFKGCDREHYRVFDWFDVKSGMEHDHDLLSSDGDFVNRVLFYPSERFGYQKKRERKDLVAISYLTQEQLVDFDYSSTMARFKITQMMKDAGIRGARNGKDVNNPEIYRYYSVKLESTERQVEYLFSNKYESDPNLEFCYTSHSDVFERLVCDPGTYASRILETLKKSQ